MSESIRWAWAAGLFEGEGTIHVAAPGKGRGRGRRLALGMCDRDVVEHFREVVGAGNIHFVPSDNESHRDYWLWHVGAWLDASRILKAMLPYFGERRTARAQEFLAYPPTGDNYKKDVCKRGHPLSGENLRLDPPTVNRPSGRRRCLACARWYETQRRAS